MTAGFSFNFDHYDAGREFVEVIVSYLLDITAGA